MDWTKLAEPQVDGYDTTVILERVAASERYAATPKCSGPKIWPDGRAAWSVPPHASAMGSDYDYLPLDDELLQRAVERLNVWPEVRKQCADILLGVTPMTRRGSHRDGAGHGCSCGQVGEDFGWVHTTVDDPWAFGEGLVHELGHWKLRALGIWFEEWTPLLLLNKPTELYVSPVRKDRARPMGAVLHAQYSYVHVTELVVRLLKATERIKASDIDWVELQMRRITEGRATVNANARGTKAGDRFLKGLDRWTGRLLNTAAKETAAARMRA